MSIVYPIKEIYTNKAEILCLKFIFIGGICNSELSNKQLMKEIQ